MKQNDCRRENDPNFHFKPIKSPVLHLALLVYQTQLAHKEWPTSVQGKNKMILLFTVLFGWALLNNSLLVTLRLDVVKSFVMNSSKVEELNKLAYPLTYR